MFSHKYIVKSGDESVLLQVCGWFIAGGAEGVYVWEPKICSLKCEDCFNQGRKESQGKVRNYISATWKWHANHEGMKGSNHVVY